MKIVYKFGDKIVFQSNGSFTGIIMNTPVVVQGKTLTTALLLLEGNNSN